MTRMTHSTKSGVMILIVSKERHYCHSCDWYRDRREADTRLETFTHPTYGKVSYFEAEERDIAFHECNEYKTAVDRLRLVINMMETY